MHTSFDYLFSAEWWVSVVVGSLLLSVLAAYVTRGIDWLRERITGQVRKKKQNRKEREEELVNSLAGNSQARIEFLLSVANRKISGLYFVVVGLAFLWWSESQSPYPWIERTFGVLSLIASLTGLAWINRGMSDERLYRRGRYAAGDSEKQSNSPL